MHLLGMRPHGWRGSLLLAVLCCLGGLVHENAEAAVALIADDAHVSSLEKNKSYGSSPVLVVSDTSRAFVRFDLSALPANLPANQIAKATMQVWVNRVSRPGSIQVIPVSAGWSEAELTFRTAPPSDPDPVATATVPEGKTRFYLTVDLTSLVREWVSGQRVNHGIMLAAQEDGASIRIDSKENTATSHEPRLEIVFAGVQGVPGPRGERGPMGPPGDAPGTVTALPVGESTEGYVSTGEFIADWKNVSGGVLNVSVSSTSIAECGGRIFAFQRIGADAVSYRFEPTTAAWDPLPSSPIFDEYSSTGTLDEGRILVFGGLTSSGIPSNRVLEFTPATNAWRERAPLRTGRRGAVGVAAEGRFFVFGGTTATGTTSSAEEYDPVANTWTPIAAIPLGNFSPYTAVSVDSVVYLYGQARNDVMLRFNAATRTWLSPVPYLPGNMRPFIETSDGKILGFSVAATRPVFQFSPEEQQWSFVGQIPTRFTTAQLAGAFRIGSSAYLIFPDLRVVALDLTSFRELHLKLPD
jgi:hypothetical protein